MRLIDVHQNKHLYLLRKKIKSAILNGDQHFRVDEVTDKELEEWKTFVLSEGLCMMYCEMTWVGLDLSGTRKTYLVYIAWDRQTIAHAKKEKMLIFPEEIYSWF